MSNETDPVVTAEPIPEWGAPCRSLIAAPTVSVKFRGLLAFCYNEARLECEVGVHNQSDHFLSVEVEENGKSVHRWTGHAAGQVNNSYFLKGSPELPYVCFYHPRETFNRETGDAKDFRWILDLESSEFYSPRRGERRRLERRGSVLRPLFTIDTGQFHTLSRSHCTYRRQDFAGNAASIIPLGKIAVEIGLNIFLGTDDYVDISIPGFNRRLRSDKLYVITFKNDCGDDSCINQGSDNPEIQSDFRFYHSTFNRRAEDTLLYIKRDDINCVEPLPGLGEGTDRAPCASAGFGSGGSLGG